MVWSKTEVDLLKRDFSITNDYELSKIIGKSPNAIRIKASRLKIRKRTSITRESLKFNGVEKQLIIGGLLGDLSCRIKKTCKYACLEGGHGAKQKEYMIWKLKLMNRLNFKIRKSKINTYLFQSKSFKSLNHYYNLFYKKGHKKIDKGILDQLNDFGILIWFLDDGSLNKRDKVMYLHTNGFSYSEQLIIKNWFKGKYKLNPKNYKSIGTKKYNGKVWYYLYFTVKDTKKLLSLFNNFEVPDCMKYKLGHIQSHSSTNMIS